MSIDALTQAWSEALAQISDQLRPATLSFLRSAKPLGDIDGTILIAVPNDFTKKWIENNDATDLTASLTNILGRSVRLAVTIDPSLEPEPEPVEQPSPVASSVGSEGQVQPSATTPHHAAPAQATSSSSPQLAIDTASTHLNPKHTFDTFVIGPSNRFAHAAAFAVSETPGRAYNPLFIHGDSGLGKTHLIHAIGHYTLSLFPQMRVRYVNSEEFTNDFINSVREESIEEFQRRYREVDVLLIDDIQFIQGKERTVEEFFHTFNSLYNAGKQIVLTSDVPPRELDLEDRIRSRFAAGLLVDVLPPDLETRIAILQKKASAENIEVDPRVLEYIAQRISSNIRELEGALVRVAAFESLSKEPVTVSMAEMLLKDFASDPQDTEVTPTLIMSQTATYFGVTIDQLSSSDRSHVVVEARQIAMYLCRELTDLSLPKIGAAFGGRDHTTVMHANKKIVGLMAEKRETFNYVTELTNRIKQAARESATLG
ncbi:chromosomal replication initiator protein DnaA [uncultured Actinomyces sp.]|uniref:chromosomal replication initiator protein DnaA n=1 Tax=uncultured Actinomyces sp. TaxID=249061 RepID=UPI0026398FCD|nr:chromosomal replication initiator protein DnaA [uncultured Actinomyces sp.]